MHVAHIPIGKIPTRIKLNLKNLNKTINSNLLTLLLKKIKKLCSVQEKKSTLKMLGGRLGFNT